MATNKEQLYNTQFNVLGTLAGDIPYVNNLADLAALPIGASKQVLVVTSGLPAWSPDVFATQVTPPVSPGAPGVAGNYAVDNNYLYIYEVSGAQWGIIPINYVWP